MYNEQLEQLIDAALADGVLTEKEKQILFKRAQSFGIDLDEFEMVLDARLFKLQSQQQSSAPKSEKYGNIRKCPACGAILDAFTTKCSECGHTFSNIEANATIAKLFEMLNEIEKESREDTNSLLGGLGRFYGDMFANAFCGGNKNIRRKKAVIQNFPIPTTKEDMLEFLAQAVPLSKASFFSDEEVKAMALVWKSKCEQIIIKAKLSMKDDPKTLDEIMNYAKVLKLKV